jgi:2-polyprenyl-3-methyl-5-hydroxy-6-metoxy-1,4-benzoquinol methylase
MHAVTQENFSQESVYDFDCGMAGHQHRLRVGRVIDEADYALHALSEQGLRETRVVEIGCGEGRLLNALVTQLEMRHPETSIRAFGFDPSSNRIRLANRLYPRYTFSEGGFEDIRFEGAVHLIICSEVIEHVNNPHELVNMIGLNLAPGGYAVMTTPNIMTLDNVLKLILGRTVTPRIPGHLREFSYAEFQKLLKARLLLESYSSIGFRLPLYGRTRRLHDYPIIYKTIFPLARFFPWWGRILVARCRSKRAARDPR